MREFDAMVAQLEPLLERGALSLQKMVYLLQVQCRRRKRIDSIKKRPS